MLIRNRSFYVAIFACFILMEVFSISAAQDNAAVITIAVSDPLQVVFKSGVLERFESENAGIRVKIVTAPQTASNPASTLEQRLQVGLEAVQAADVQLVSRFELNTELTRAGYFLDLKPLIDADAALKRDDFFPALRTAFEWDGGVWALPVVADRLLTIYATQAFDAAGLTYPDGKWTIDNFANAARALAKTSDGKKITGMWVNSSVLPIFFYTLLGEDFADTTTIPSVPDLGNPNLAALLKTWHDLEAEGVVTTDYFPGAENAPLQINGSYVLSPVSNAEHRDALPKAALLPGNKAGLEALGFAVSAGTSYPDAAYKLVKFLTGAREMQAVLPGGSLARQTVTGSDSSGMDFTYPADIQAVLDQALQVGFSNASLLYQEDVMLAFKAVSGGQDPLDALAAAQTQASADMTAVIARHNSTIIVVATPVPDVAVGADEVSIKFAMWNYSTDLPNRADWEKVIAEFVAADPQVANIQFNFITPTSPNWQDGIEQSNDCMYAASNTIDDASLDLRLSLDPLIDADPNFDKSDMVNGALEQVQRNGKTWAIPITVQPYLLRYDPVALADAQLTVPAEGWTVNEFIDALNVLKPLTGSAPAFYPYEFTGNHLLMLLASLGVLPIDYRTDPPTIDFTSPDTVAAIRQILDLAKNGQIHYEEWARAVRIFNLNPPSDLHVIFGDDGTFDQGVRSAIMPFPHGSQFTPVSYTVTTAYISATSQNPEACYRWISTFAKHPELFNGMPVRRSLINSNMVSASKGTATVATYQQIDQVLSAQNTIVFSDNEDFTIRLWLLRAFDRYVLHDADVETELADAEHFTKEYLACAAAIPASTTPNDAAHKIQRNDCAAKVDPTLIVP